MRTALALGRPVMLGQRRSRLAHDAVNGQPFRGFVRRGVDFAQPRST
ncbi:MAG: hypothetical protein JO023_01345 [Chloroflexi bacterium]|nr:hypothetical protein [Chloroflexota bacterium]